ncbi:staygreen family protein [Bacillus sp. RAR_GA_16]|uniref:staygreen family protein n=1 Tax=Bacillus sp. RAR_GA_16 TaxID=2876774 RepID=UPI001CCAA032|nr:staygreen family protein [Bacillus sp. RAR_GA_16]MCA0173610.1 staygreen family protein [Bacillus sp. RAR_GA_16]
MKQQPQVTYRDGLKEKNCILGRKYTLTHSDLTGELFLTIGKEYAIDRISFIRDEVLGSFRNDCGLYYYVYVLVDDPTEEGREEIRNRIFREELPDALSAIRVGDSRFFQTYPQLDDVPIWIYFDSNKEQWEAYEYYGSFREYRNSQHK